MAKKKPIIDGQPGVMSEIKLALHRGDLVRVIEEGTRPKASMTLTLPAPFWPIGRISSCHLPGCSQSVPTMEKSRFHRNRRTDTLT